MQFSDCKMKKFLLQANGLQIFPGKNPFLCSTFQYLNYNSRPFGLPPKPLTFQFPNASYSSIFSAHAHDWLSNCRTFQSCSSITIHFVFSFVCPSCDPVGFGSTSTKRPVSLRAAVVRPISKTHLQSNYVHHSSETHSNHIN